MEIRPAVVDKYIATVTSAQRLEFERIRQVVIDMLPAVEQGTSYKLPAYFYKGKPVLSAVATKKHLSIYPFSGKVIDIMRGRLSGFSLSSGTIRFSVEHPIPEPLLRQIIALRMEEIDGNGTAK